MKNQNIQQLKITKKEREGKVAVLYSPRFGTDWSSSVNDPITRYNILFDSNIVNYVEEKNFVDLKIYMKMHYPDIFLDTIHYLEICWIQKGTIFKIEKSYGSETVKIIDKVDFIVA